MNSMTEDQTTAAERRLPPVEDRGDELVVRRPDWMTDEQWATVAAGLRERGWNADHAGCPTWCADHRTTDATIPADVMNEHRSRVLVSTARSRGDGPAIPDQPARVWVEEVVWSDEHEEPVVIAQLPSDDGHTSLTPAQARDLADSLLEAADLLDGLGQTNGAQGGDR